MSLIVSNDLKAVLPLGEQLAATRRLVKETLSPLTVKIDLEGLYPESFLRQLGAIDGFRQHLAAARPDGVTDMGAAIQTMAAVSHIAPG